ncbi:MAG: cell wall-binding repeat-containing protein, partial [Micrococcales bacterium]|nr:cell wall-binding repeat-containing protein [Micrococcales bacterium]
TGASALAGPQSSAPSTSPKPTPGKERQGAEAFGKALDRVRAARGLAPALAAIEPPNAPALWVSDGTGATRWSLDTSYVGSLTTTLTDRTDVVVGPAGDSMAYSAAGATHVAPLPLVPGANVVDYPASSAPVSWGPGGDGFALTTGSGIVAQATNPDFSVPIATPTGAQDPAVSPYAGDMFVRTGSGGSTDIADVPAPFIGSTGASATTQLSLTAYAPEAPGVGQEPGTGVTPGVNDGATYLAFVGKEGSNPARLYVDHQDAPSPSTNNYGAPVAVADAGFQCDSAAPVFSPDRRHLAYVKATGPTGNECSAFEVHTVSADSGGRYTSSSADVVTATVPTKPTVLSFETSNPAADFYRVDGANRYDVAANAALFYDPAVTNGAVLAGGTAYADALAGGPLAVAVAGPSLLTPKTALNASTQYGLESSVAKGKTVYILGGTGSVSTTVENQVKALGYATKRLGGANRYDVAVNVAKELDTLRGSLPTAAFVSSGSAFADALVAGPPAASYDAPILLSAGATLPAVTKTYLDSLPGTAEVFAIGGSGAASVATDPRTEVVGGANRYDVASNVARRFFAGSWILAVADGRNWPDAASAGGLMGAYGQPILLSSGTTALPPSVASLVRQTRESYDSVLVFGGPASVPAGTATTTVSLAGRQTTYYGPAFQ